MSREDPGIQSDENYLPTILEHRRGVENNIQFAKRLERNGIIDGLLGFAFIASGVISTYFARENAAMYASLCLSGVGLLGSAAMAYLNLTSAAQVDATARASIEARNKFENTK